jgi:aryl-alcohol dehydrogenase-like predicted oxidoreductase
MDRAARLQSLGATSLQVSDIGLGLAALGRPGYINVGHGDDLGGDRSRGAMEQRAHDVLDAAYAAGVRYFDAARSYGTAEAFLASWLSSRHLEPGDVVIGSKWGYTYTADWQVEAPVHEIKDHSVSTFSRQLAESRALLGRHLALYQIHSATLDSGVLDDAAVIDALARAREGGVRIGLSVSGAGQADTIWRALEVERDGERVFDTVQATWNLLERSAESALSAASDAGLGVIVKEALANGRLSDRGVRDDASSAQAPLAREAVALGTSADAVAIACVLAKPWASVVLSGATTVPQLESNLRSRQVKITPAATERLATLAVDSASYWRERSALPWN